jgi:histidinol phosphatase-like enzyme (inositol monophosphatase family)
MTNEQIFLEFALESAWLAGRITLGHFQNGVTVERKSDNSPVTIADRAAEQFLRERITHYWPDHGIIGEEYGRQTGSTDFTWIIDPIDGTKSFSHGVPLYANLLALTDTTGSLVGVANYPALNETVYAARGQGCFWNGRRCRVSKVSSMADAVMLTSEINGFNTAGKAAIWQQLIDQTYFQRTWGDAYGYALVATGRAEIMVEPWLAIWDAAPFQVILEEAGGTFTDWRGQRSIDAGQAVATNGLLFESVITVTRG